MNCPECGVPFPIWERNCLNCGENILEGFERRARASARPPASPAKSAAPAPRRTSRSLGLALGLLLAAGAWWAAAGRRASVAPRSYDDPSAGLAFAAPPGWRVRPGRGAGWRFRRIALLTGPGGRIEVESAPEHLPVREHLGEILNEEFTGRRPQLESLAGSLVAGGQAVRVSFRAENGPVLPPIVGEAVYLPGAGRNYLIRFYSDAAEYPRAKADWTAFLGSVRLTARR